MKTLALIITALIGIQASASSVSVPWKSVTCAELQTLIQNNAIVHYGSKDLFNKNAVAYSERTDFCQDYEKDFRVRAKSATPVATSDKKGLFNLCKIGSLAFTCEDKIDHR